MAECIIFVLLLVSAGIYVESKERRIGNLTDDQYAGFKLFKTFVTQFENPDYLKADLYLLRWLQAYNFDVKRAQEKFSNSYTWRQENKIDQILAEDFPVSIQDEYPFTIESFDKVGRPVAYAPTGRYNFRKMAIKGQTEAMHRFGIMCQELMEAYIYELQCSGNWRRDIKPQYTLINDMSSGSMWTIACYNCLAGVPDYIAAYDNNYPELMYRAVLVNVPKLLVVVLNSLKVFMSPATQEAIHIYGYDKEEWAQVLLEMISPDQLPILYGGLKNNPPVSSKNNGTWNWNNPIIEKILRKSRENSASPNTDNCVTKLNSIPTIDDSSNEITNDGISAESHDKIDHRDEHGLHPAANSSISESDLNLIPTNSSTARDETKNPTDDDLGTNNIFPERSDGESSSDDESVTVLPDALLEDLLTDQSVTETNSALNLTNSKESNDDFVFENTAEENKTLVIQTSSGQGPYSNLYFTRRVLIYRALLCIFMDLFDSY